jgi:hypothetical protein
MMQQASSPVLQQQLRSLHPGALQTLHQSPDGTLYSQPLPELPSDVYQQQYALSGPPQPPSHALPVHFEQQQHQQHQHALPSQAPYQPFAPANYQHATSPRFMNAAHPPLQHAQHTQQYHASPPQPVQRPIQQLPLPPPAPLVLAAPQPIQQQAEDIQPPSHQGARDEHDTALSNHGQFHGLKLIANPPDVEEWREKLFHVDDMITLTEEQ